MECGRLREPTGNGDGKSGLARVLCSSALPIASSVRGPNSAEAPPLRVIHLIFVFAFFFFFLRRRRRRRNRGE